MNKFFICDVCDVAGLGIEVNALEGFSGTVGGGHYPRHYHTVITTSPVGEVVGEFTSLEEAREELHRQFDCATEGETNAFCTLYRQ